MFNAEFLKAAIRAVIRAAVQALGGYFALAGLTGDSLASFTSGLAAVLTMIAWSLIDKWFTEKKVEVALALPPGATRETLEVAVKQ